MEVSVDFRGTYNSNGQAKFKTLMLKSSLCDYSDAYILVRRTMAIAGAGDDAAARQADERNKKVIFKKLWAIHKLHKRNKYYSSTQCKRSLWCCDANVQSNRI